MRVAARAAMLAGSLLASCGGDPPTGPPPGTPRIGISPAQIGFVGVGGGGNPVALTTRITNAATGSLTALQVGSVTYGPAAAGWLGATLDVMTAPATLTLTPSVAGLASGNYTATVSITSTAAENSPQSVGVSLLVLDQGSATALPAAGIAATFLDVPAFATRLALDPGAAYLIAVVNTATTSSATEDFTLAGALLTPSALAPAPSIAELAPPAPPRAPSLALRRAEASQLGLLRRLTHNHVRMVESNRELYARLDRARAQRTSRPRAPAQVGQVGATSLVSETIGDVNQVYVRNDVSGGCADVDSIGARTVAVGDQVIVLADTNLTAWPDQFRPDSAFYQTFADEYDQITWPRTLTFIGDPLLLDGDLSGVGKVTAVFTPILNTLGGGVVAFVNPCDFFPTVSTGPDANFSNFTEIFYSLVPASNFPIEIWQKQLRATAVHETKHIVAIASRIQADSPSLDEVWLEEGLAQIASEIWMRDFNQAAWKGSADFFETVACEINLGASAPCNLDDTRPFALVISHLPFLWDYLLTQTGVPPAALGAGTASNYGGGWAIARWAIDRYAVNEATFVRALIAEPVQIGLDNLSTHTGEPIPALLAYWNLATAIYGPRSFTPQDPRVAFPSFDLANIFGVGQTELTCSGAPCGLFTESGLPVYPVQPASLTAGSFSSAVIGVPGTGASYFRLSAPAGGTQVLQLLSGNGGAIAPTSALRVAILRVQ